MTYAIRRKPLYVETPMWNLDRKSFKPDLSVSGRKETNTGLLTASGDPIYRIQPPIGFGRDEER